MLIDEVLQMVWEDASKSDKYTVTITKEGCIVAYICTKRILRIYSISSPSPPHLLKVFINFNNYGIRCELRIMRNK